MIFKKIFFVVVIASFTSCGLNNNQHMEMELNVDSNKKMKLRLHKKNDYVIRLSLIDNTSSSIYKPDFKVLGTIKLMGEDHKVLHFIDIPEDYRYTFNSKPLVLIKKKSNLNTKVKYILAQNVRMINDENSVYEQPVLVIRNQKYYSHID